MKKAFIHLIFLALLMAGCITSKSSTVAIGSDGITSSTPELPVIQLESDGKTIQGLESAFYWVASDGKSEFGAQNLIPNPPNYPDKLVAIIGQSIDIVILTTNLPSAIVVAEADAQGTPIASTMVKPTSNRTPYSLVSKDQHYLQVTAQWLQPNYETYFFEVDIVP
jgi:hypothetical protein